MNKKQKIILITVDSLRADHLGYMNYQRNISPNIDALAKESLVFSKAYSVGPTTLHSFPSILSSTYPLDYQGPYMIEKPRKLISEVLKEQGIVTAAFHSSPFLSDHFGYNKGWDFFEDIKKPAKKKISPKRFKEMSIKSFPKIFIWLSYLKRRIKGSMDQRIKASFLTQVVKDFILSKKDDSFFVWVHYMDLHSPYFARDNFQKKPFSFSEYVAAYSVPLLAYYPSRRLKKIARDHIELTKELYDEGIKYLDEQIKGLIGFLKEENVYDDCIIIFAGDHGEEFLEHGSGAHFSKLYNELLHIPLFIKIPGRFAEEIKDPVSLIDLSPTICDLLDIQKDSSFKGNNLLKRPDAPVFHQIGSWKINIEFLLDKDYIKNSKIESSDCYKIGCQFKNWKYILDYKTKGEELYNLLIDPGEKNNIINQEKEMISKMRNITQEFLKDNPPFSSTK